MIVAVASHSADSGKRLLTQNMAWLRAGSGRKVVLLDADPGQSCLRWGQDRAAAGLRPPIAVNSTHRGHGIRDVLEQLQAGYNDVVIDSGQCDTLEARGALIAAQVVVVPIAPGQAGIALPYSMISRLNAARMFNPGLRVLFVIASGERDPNAEEVAAVRAYAGQVMSARVAATIVHLPALRWGAARPGSCSCDIENSVGAAEMAALYGQVFSTSNFGAAHTATPPQPEAGAPGGLHSRKEHKQP